MPELYISNSSRQVHEVQWTDRRGAPHSTRITSGSRARIGGDDLAQEQINRIIQGHLKYGLIAESQARPDFVGLAYSIVEAS
jgi:hypothetical protein